MNEYLYTVYCADEVVDIATEREVGELLHIFKDVVIDYQTMVVTIVE